LTQFFTIIGYTATQTGWKNDVYQLASIQQEQFGGKGNKECLYAKISTIHALYLKDRNALQTETERVVRYQQYQKETAKIREDHIVQLNLTLELSKEAEWLVYKKPVAKTEGWFHREENLKYKMTIICVLVVCWWGSIIGIYNKILLQEAVTLGLRVIDQVDSFSWAAFYLFIALELVYFYADILSGLKKIGGIFSWFAGGCKFDAEIETRFDTPLWGKYEREV